jgi:hypothetical protein
MGNGTKLSRISFVELARLTECALEDLVGIAHSTRLPFVNINGRLFIENKDVTAWRKRCEEISDG